MNTAYKTYLMLGSTAWLQRQKWKLSWKAERKTGIQGFFTIWCWLSLAQLFPSTLLITLVLALKDLSLHTICPISISTCPNPTHSSKHGLNVKSSPILTTKSNLSKLLQHLIFIRLPRCYFRPYIIFVSIFNLKHKHKGLRVKVHGLFVSIQTA